MTVVAAYAMALGEYYALRFISDPGNNGESTFSIVTPGATVAAVAVVLPALVEDDLYAEQRRRRLVDPS